MAKLEFRLVVLEDGKEVFTEPISSELLSTIANYYPDKISSRIFFKFASIHPSAEVRQQAAYKYKLDEESCRVLAEDNSVYVLKNLLRNPAFKEVATLEMIEKIMKKDPELALTVAQEVELYKMVDVQKLAEIVASNSDPSVVLALAQNSRTSKKVLRDISMHDDPSIADSARENLK